MCVRARTPVTAARTMLLTPPDDRASDARGARAEARTHTLL